jgi:hypothetical protein
MSGSKIQNEIINERKIKLINDLTNIFPKVIAKIITDYDYDVILDKLDILRKLGEIKQLGVNLSQNYNLDSDLEMMTYEYNIHQQILKRNLEREYMEIIISTGTYFIGQYFGFDLHEFSDMCKKFYDQNH